LKVSYEWIRKYVPTKLRADSLAEKLTMAGMEVTSVEQKGDDFIFEIEITSNRADCLSHIGIAREVAAVTKKPLLLPAFDLKPYFTAGTQLPQALVKEHQLCARYTVRLITGVRVGPSPKWLVERIESVGLRPINNVVDITNFVLFETGQPLHAFDYDKLAGNKVIVRLAKEGEEIITIDGQKRKLKNTTLIIADQEKPVAIAGIMGSTVAEVGPSTKRVLLEAASFDPVSIRRSSRYLALSTDSSYRFERGVDISSIVAASDRAASLICEIAKGKAHKKITDIGVKRAKSNIITIRQQKVNAVLGTAIPGSQIKSGLVRLGFKVSAKGATMKVTAPSFRPDAVKEIDLIEEIARVYGYDNIPSRLPCALVTEPEACLKRKNKINDIIRNTLSGLGFSEIITYSLVARDDLKALDAPQMNIISVQNPLSDQQEVMRNTLLPGALKVIEQNINKGNKNIKLFELSNVYFEKDSNPQEEQNLLLATCGESSTDWRRKAQKMDLFYLKGILKAMFDRLGADIYFEVSQHPNFDPSCTVAILSNNRMLGVVGKLKQQALLKAGIKTEVCAAEITMRIALENIILQKIFENFSRYPASERDISMCISEDISFENINAALREAGGLIIKEARLVEEYRGKQIPQGQRSLLIRVTYQSKDKTLTEKEIDSAHSAVVKKLNQDFNATIR